MVGIGRGDDIGWLWSRPKIRPLTNSFFILEENLEVRFVKNAQGGVTEIQVRAGGNTMTGKKAK